MIVKELEVRNELGFHARVVSRLVREAKKFESAVSVRKGQDLCDLKNIMGAIMVNAKKGDILTVEFNGADEQQASESITQLFSQKFGER
ncbi:MAG: HPr family phosphocarrier protein [Oscillospiraceae bacterium]|jgi:phosphocarrier protein|nr:HPr family phosphocarrier protein [Oscillospiraceae bacterium]